MSNLQPANLEVYELDPLVGLVSLEDFRRQVDMYVTATLIHKKNKRTSVNRHVAAGGFTDHK